MNGRWIFIGAGPSAAVCEDEALSLSPQIMPPGRGAAEMLDMLVARDGTGAHAHVRSGQLANGPDAMRNLADAVHFLCLLHGRHPGVIDSAARKAVDAASREWLAEAADAFVGERAFLSTITAALGPAPSTPGQAECEAAVAGQRRALDMLAESERHGCAVGAAIALTLDWRTIRILLDISAERLDIAPQRSTLPDLPATARLADALAQTAAVERAMLFGAQQLVAQHAGLWDMLSARAASRAHG